MNYVVVYDCILVSIALQVLSLPQHVDDLLCSESFSRDVCLPCKYSNGSSLTLKVDSFLGGRSQYKCLLQPNYLDIVLFICIV